MIGKLVKTKKTIAVYRWRGDPVNSFSELWGHLEEGVILTIIAHVKTYEKTRTDKYPNDWVYFYNNIVFAADADVYNNFNKHLTIIENNEKDVKTV